MMDKRTRSFSEWRQQKLADPTRAVRYLKAAKKESNEAFLHAVKNVIQANEVARIAREVGVSRESIYRSFSAEGNPAFHTVEDILKVVGIELDFKVVGVAPPTSVPSKANRTAQANPVANMNGKGTGMIEYNCGAPANLRILVADNVEAPVAVHDEGVPALLPGFLQEQQRLAKFQRING